MTAKIEAGANWHSKEHLVNGVTLPDPYTVKESNGSLKCQNGQLQVHIATKGYVTGLGLSGKIPWGSKDLDMEAGMISHADKIGFPPSGIHYQLDSNKPVWQFGEEGTDDYLKVTHLDLKEYLKEEFLEAISLNPPGVTIA